MHQFKDTAGRTWDVESNVAAVKKVRDLTKIDLYRTLTGNLSGYSELVSDPVKLVDVLFVLCLDQARAAHVKDEDFGRAMAGDVLESALDALTEEMIAFYPARTQRDALASMVSRAKQVTAILQNQTLEAMNQVSPMEVAAGMLPTN